MPGIYCAIYGCNNNTNKRNSGSSEALIFHSFPKGKDFVSRTIRDEWVRRCNRQDKFSTFSSRICSIHFVDNDYERDLQNELLGLPLRRFLNKTAVPTVNIWKKSNYVEKSSRQKRFEEKQATLERKYIIEDILQGDSFNKEIATSSNEASTSNIEDQHLSYTENSPECDINLKEKYEKLLTENTTLKKLTQTQAKSIENLQKTMQLKSRKIKLLTSQVGYYKNKRLTQSPKKEQMAFNILKSVLTQNQIDLLLKKKKRVNWTKEEIAVAFTIRYYSKSCYLYLKKKLNYPLPSLSSLRRWASNLDLTKGLLSDVVLMLKLAGETMDPFEKTVVLEYDEMKIKAVEEYDVKHDELLGPHNQMQVVMARGLFSSWKQPVYLAFDQKMTKEILLNIITELHKISFNVVACVSDCGGSNIGLWKNLGVSVDKTFFEHPLTKQNIYMFADAPHLLKLIRNWLLDNGFILQDGTIITKAPLQTLLSSCNHELKSFWKITQKHLDVEKSQRQNVRLAAQLLSNTVSTALLRYKPGGDSDQAENLGNFIGKINRWFDLLNSYTEIGTVPTKNAYGVNLTEQDNVLNETYELFNTMRVTGKGSLMTFQKGMLISITSLKSLYQDMKKQLNIKYILAHKINQDCLENFFFQVRSKGGPDEHPTPLNAIYRIRMIMLGKNPGILDAKVNTEDRKQEEYICPKVIKTAKISASMETLQSQLNESLANSSNSSISSILSNSSTQNVDSTNVCEESSNDALEYIAGYLAKKYKDSLSLGQFTYKEKDDHSYVIPSWVQQLSYGGLIKPTKEWLKIVKKWNSYFELYHGDSYRETRGVVGNLAKNIFKKQADLPFKLVRDFCKLRTVIRMNFRNNKAKLNKNLKRRTDKTDTGRKKLRKLEKIVQ